MYLIKTSPVYFEEKADFELSQCFQDDATVLSAGFGREGHGWFRAVGLWDPLGTLVPASQSLGYPAVGQRPLLGDGSAARGSAHLQRWRRNQSVNCIPVEMSLNWKGGFSRWLQRNGINIAFCRIKLKHVGLVLFWQRKAKLIIF